LILNDKSLVAPSEDWLYRCISRRIEANLSSASLFEFICFEFLSVSSIEHFIDWSLRHSIDISGGIWRGLCARLSIDVREFVTPRFSHFLGRVVCNFDRARPLDGIVAYLTRQCGGNVADSGIVGATANSVFHQGYGAKNALDLTVDSRYGSQPRPNQWLCIDFKEREVAITHYSIRSQFNSGVGGAHPKSWVLEGSADKSVWSELDVRKDNAQLNAQNTIATWRTNVSERVRYVRLRMTGPNHARGDALWISSFELFGILYEPGSE
jgi:hypothetical protein